MGSTERRGRNAEAKAHESNRHPQIKRLLFQSRDRICGGEGRTAANMLRRDHQ